MAAKAGSTKGGGKVTDLSTARARKGGDGSTPPPAPRGPGSNPIPNGPTREEREALYLRHFNAIEAQEAVVEQAKAVFDGAKKNLNALRKTAQGDGIKLGVFDRARELARLPKHEAVEEILLARDYQEWLGLGFLGEQGLDATPAAAMDELQAEAEGYLAGLRAELRKPPQDLGQQWHQAWMAGYDRGQERNVWALNPEKEPRRAQPAPEPAAAASAPAETEDAPSEAASQPDPAPEPDQEPVQEGEPDAAAVFAAFGQSTEGDSDDGFEMSAEELAAQKGRPQAEDGE